MEKEAKKEAFRKYLESSGVLDALTKVLVALYEQNDKPSSALEFIQQKLGGPTMSEFEKQQAETSELQIRYNELLAAHQETCRERKTGIHEPSLSIEDLQLPRALMKARERLLEELKNSHAKGSSKEMGADGGASNEG